MVGIVAFGFGAPYTIAANKQLAFIVEREVKHYEGAPVYTQLDIQIVSGIDVERIPEISGQPPPTLRIARGAVAWALKRGITKFLIVAAAPHLRRCMRDMKWACDEVGIKPEIWPSSGINEFSKDSWFCPDSTQERTRSLKDWRFREFLLCHMPKFLYKRVAA